MATDRLLAALLRSLQNVHVPQDTAGLFPTATSLLTTLRNPANISLLTRQLLIAPAIWNRPDGLRTCLQVLSIFHTAGTNRGGGINSARAPGSLREYSDADNDIWVKAVAAGADEQSPRWKHLLPLGGLLLSMDGRVHPPLYSTLKGDVERAVVKAVNLALSQSTPDELRGGCVTLVLNYTFELLPNVLVAELDYDALLPTLVEAAFFSAEGFQSGYLLGTIDQDIVHVKDNKFTWLPMSPTFLQAQKVSSRPLVASMGPLSRLIAHAVKSVRSPLHIHNLVEALLNVSRTTNSQWRANKLSEIDASEEAVYLDEVALKRTIPLLWQILRSVLFAMTIVMKSIMGRLLIDGELAKHNSAPTLSTQILHTMRNVYFISSRLGSNAFSSTTFVFLTAIDVLSRYPAHTESFLLETKPSALGELPPHPLDRCLDLFFLNTAENLTLTISPQINEDILIAAAMPYLTVAISPHLIDIFEAAHSVVLTVLVAPKNVAIAQRIFPFYIDTLFKVFPTNLSPRQYRVAIKTLVRIASPPSSLSFRQPDLASTILEMLHHRALSASGNMLPPLRSSISQVNQEIAPLSEQAVLTLAILDALPSLSLEILEEWLPISASLINYVKGPQMAEVCRRRLWEVLYYGEMDVDRAQICLVWWGTRGGREMALRGPKQGIPEPLISAALEEASGQ